MMRDHTIRLVLLTAAVMTAAGAVRAERPAFPTSEPEVFHAACGMEPEVAYTFRVHQFREQGGTVSRDAHGLLVLVLSSEDVTAITGEGGSLVIATIELGEQTLTDDQMAMLGLSPDDVRSDAEFLVDAEYNIVGLRNWEALRDETRSMTTRLIGAMVRARQFDADTARRAREMVRDMTATEQGVVQMYGKRLYPYLFGYGWQLAEGDEIEYQVELPNPIGGEPILAVNTTRLDDDPATEGVVEYGSQQRLDPASVAVFLQAYMDRLGAAVPADTREEMLSMRIDDLMAWEYDSDAGLISRTVYERIVAMPGTEPMTERWTWELAADD
ncbi:MAG: hypothetical protein ACTS22_08495 [Phycisphaerales bacterium]